MTTIYVLSSETYPHNSFKIPQGNEYSDGVIQGYEAAHPRNSYKLTHEEGENIFCRNFRIINEANRRNILDGVISEN